MTYRNLAKLRKDHPARNTALGTINAERRNPGTGRWATCKTTWSGKQTFNQLEARFGSDMSEWRVPKEGK